MNRNRNNEKEKRNEQRSDRGRRVNGTVWRKSSRSIANGDCVEVGYRKSSFSTYNGNCVEVGADGRVLVRDTKNRDGFVLTVTAGAWREFTGRLR